MNIVECKASVLRLMATAIPSIYPFARRSSTSPERTRNVPLKWMSPPPLAPASMPMTSRRGLLCKQDLVNRVGSIMEHPVPEAISKGQERLRPVRILTQPIGHPPDRGLEEALRIWRVHPKGSTTPYDRVTPLHTLADECPVGPTAWPPKRLRCKPSTGCVKRGSSLSKALGGMPYSSWTVSYDLWDAHSSSLWQ